METRRRHAGEDARSAYKWPKERPQIQSVLAMPLSQPYALTKLRTHNQDVET